MPIQAYKPSPVTIEIGAGEVLPSAAISAAGMLRSGQTLTGTPTLTVTPSNAPDATPTATSPQVNSGAITVNGETVAVGEAIQFTLTGNSAAKGCYTITWSCGTSDSGTLQGAVTFKIV